MRLHAVALIVPDYDAALDFFVGGLGFDLLADVAREGGKRWVLVRPPGGGSAILLARADGPVQDAAIGNQAAGRVGFFLQADDWAEARARLTAAGAAWEEDGREEPYGRVAVWRDPWGNRWDLLGPPPLRQG